MNMDSVKDDFKRYREEFSKEYDFDPGQFYVFSRDFMRVDVGLMISRPAIFARMR